MSSKRHRPYEPSVTHAPVGRRGHLSIVPQHETSDTPEPGTREWHIAQTIAQRSGDPAACRPIASLRPNVVLGDDIVVLHRLDALEQLAGVQAVEVRAMRSEVAAQAVDQRATRSAVAEIERSISELKHMVASLRGGGGQLLAELIERLGGPVTDEGDLDPETMADIFSLDNGHESE